jgi:hypothetical protein
MTRSFVFAFALLGVAAAADFTGTWKLNTAKSKYEGLPMPKEQTATYTPKGSGWEYTVKGTSSTGQPIQSSFTYVADGVEAKTTGFPYWDSLVTKNGKEAKSTVQLKREGKVVGMVTRTLSADGKVITLTGKVTLPDGKTATYNAVYDKQ